MPHQREFILSRFKESFSTTLWLHSTKANTLKFIHVLTFLLHSGMITVFMDSDLDLLYSHLSLIECTFRHLTSFQFLHEIVYLRQSIDTLSVFFFSSSMDVLSSIWIFPALPFLPGSQDIFNILGWRLTYLWGSLFFTSESPWSHVCFMTEALVESSKGLELSCSQDWLIRESKVWSSSCPFKSSRSGVGEFGIFSPCVCEDWRCHKRENFRLFSDSCMSSCAVCSNCTLDRGTSRQGAMIRGFNARKSTISGADGLFEWSIFQQEYIKFSLQTELSNINQMINEIRLVSSGWLLTAVVLFFSAQWGNCQPLHAWVPHYYSSLGKESYRM